MVMFAPMPMPLPVPVDFTVTSAKAGARKTGATGATGATSATSARRIKRFIQSAPIEGTNSLSLLLAAGRTRLGVLRPLVRPVQHLRHRMQHRFAGGVAMRLERQRDVAHGRAVALQRALEALGLD